MGTHDGRIDHRIFVVGICGQMLEDPRPDTGLGPAGKARMNRLPVSEALGQVPPRHAGSVSVQNRLNKQPVVLGGYAHVTLTSGQQILDPIPFVVVQSIAPHRSALLKADRLRVTEKLIWESARIPLRGPRKIAPPFDATKIPPNDSALFPLRFTGVHGAAGLDQQRDRFSRSP